MLTAFLAIFKDSFRAVMASRVLYVLLGIITVVLLALAPLHIRETLDWKLNPQRHVQDQVALALKLHRGSESDAKPGLKRIWEKLPDKLRENITKIATAPNPLDPALLDAPAESGNPLTLRLLLLLRLEEGLNEVFESNDLYQPEAWQRVGDAEARGLVEKGVDQLTENQRRRLNRLLVTAELSPALGPADQASLETWYGPWQWLTVSTTRQAFLAGFASSLSYIFDKFVMSIGLFIAILVTSGMIPEMFEPGSLNLLLSKPVPRWLLLLGKFVGGCAFITLCAAYLFLGLWLWLGLAGGLWDRGLLWSVPLYVVVFAIYFSVSLLVGILFRSAIVSVILTVVFWGFCFATGSTWGLFDTRVRNDRLALAWEQGDALLAADCQQRVYEWNPDARSWDERIGHNLLLDQPEQKAAMGMLQFLIRIPSKRLLGPVPVGDDGLNLIGTPAFFDPENEASFPVVLHALQPGSPGKPLTLGELPGGTVAMLATPAGPVLFGNGGEVQLLERDKLMARLAEAPGAPDEGNPAGTGDLFVKAGPDEREVVSDRERVTTDPVSGDLFVLRRNELSRFVWNDGDRKYQRSGKRELSGGSSARGMAGWVVAGPGVVAAAWGTGQITLVDPATLEETGSFWPDRSTAIDGLELGSDGRWLVVRFRGGKTLVLDCRGDRTVRPLPGNLAGPVETVSFDGPGGLIVCHATNRVSRLDLESGRSENLASPRGNWLHNLHRLIINPFYQLAPKPGEFYKLVTHLSATGNAAVEKEADLTRIEYQPSPWSPLWSGLSFMAVMLTISAWLFNRGDY